MKHLGRILLMLPLTSVFIETGCARMESGPPPVATVSGQKLGLTQEAYSWPTTKWWEQYQDPQLNALIEEALAHHPSITAAQARLAQANAVVRVTQAPLRPRVDLNYTLTREKISNNYIYPAPLAGSTQTDTGLALNFNYELDFWGKNRASLKAALSQQQASVAETHAASMMLTNAILQSYLNLQNTFAQREIGQRLIAQQRTTLELVRQRAAAGLDTQVQVKQAESELANAKVQLVQIDTTLAQLRHQVAMLTGAGPARGQGLHASALPTPVVRLPTSIPLELLGRRADIVAARWRVKAARHTIDVAKTEFYPNVNLAAFLGLQALGIENLLKTSSYTHGIGPAISLPIFHGGALNANLTRQQAQTNIAITDYNQTVLNAVYQVAGVLDEHRLLDQQILEQRQARQSIDAAYTLALKRYRQGLGSYLTVLAVQNSQLIQTQRDTDLRFRAYKLEATLINVLGGGYLEAPPRLSHKD